MSSRTAPQQAACFTYPNTIPVPQPLQPVSQSFSPVPANTKRPTLEQEIFVNCLSAPTREHNEQKSQIL